MNYNDIYIVGIGSSAGGFEALQKFLSKIILNENICYVILQHLDSKRPTLLGELLSKYSGLVINEIKENDEVKGGHIYYCPPNANLTIKDGLFLFDKMHQDSPTKPSIDLFFTSLAQEKKEKAVAIILSGTGSDGTKGIVEISKYGGIALAEDEGAKYYSMPKSAIDTGKVLASLPPELLADGIIDVIEDRDYFDKHFEIEDSIHKIFNILQEETSIDFSSYKQATIIRRIKKRILDRKADGINEYIKILLKDEEEVIRLKDELLIIVTSFFRDDEAFKELKNNLKELIEQKLDNTIRIWVTACATGEEAFSIAMIVSDILENLNISKKVTIFATDASEKIIEKCRNRVFTIEELDGVSNYYLKKYFEENQNTFKINKKIRDMIVFSKHDLIKDAPFLNLDMVSCRNLLIYFNNKLQRRVLSIFYYAMRYESLLFLGKSETVGSLTSYFSIVNNKFRIYKKLNDLAKVDLESLTYRNRNVHHDRIKDEERKSNLIEIDTSINKAISDRYKINGVVIDGKNHNILYYKGDCKDFLNHPQGVQTSDIFRIIADYLRLDFRATLNEAKKLNKFVLSKRIRILPSAEPKEYIVIGAYPLSKNKLGENTFLISFDKIVDNTCPTNDDFFDPIDINNSNLSLLEDELLTLKERLQITIEELETSNEDLQSTNEELQSTNEELETSNEELQSTNEELHAVNDELNTKNLELDFANNAFNSVLKNIGAYVLILDFNLKIIKYTEGILEFFDFSKCLENTFTSILINSHIALPNLLEDIKSCMNSGNDIFHLIEFKNKHYHFSIKKINLSGISKIGEDQGLILSFIDKTEYFKQDQLIFEQAKLVSMGEMITNISHQWRQPLSMITTVASGVKLNSEYESLEQSYIEKNMDIVLEQANYLSRTIDNFRNFARVNNDFGKTTIIKVIEDTIKLVDASLKNNYIELILDIHDDIEIKGSKNELVEALINIVHNSKSALKDNIKDDSNRFIFIKTKKPLQIL